MFRFSNTSGLTFVSYIFSFEDRFFVRSTHRVSFHRQYKEDESQSEEEKDYRSLDASPTYKGLLMVWGLHG